MKRYISDILTLLAIIVIIGGTIWLSQPVHKNKIKRAAVTPRLIKTAYPVRRDFSVYLNWFGRVESKRAVRIISPIDGQITEIKVTDGSFVKKRQLLFKIGGNQILQRLKILRQHVISLKKQIALARNIVYLKKKAVIERVAKKEELFSAQEQLIQLKNKFFIAKEKLAGFKKFLSIYSPMDGIFTNRQVSSGQNIKKGVYLADIISRDLRVKAFCFPPDKALLTGKTAIIQTRLNRKITGKITRVLPERSPEGATIVWIEGSAISKNMQPGEMASGWIVLEVHKNCLAVPKDAVVQNKKGQTFVFVKTKRGYKKTPVKLGNTEGGYYEVISGISDNDEIVVNGAYELFYQNFAKSYKVAD